MNTHEPQTPEESAQREGRITHISDALVTARTSGTALPGFPGNLPADLAEAYAVQERSLSLWQDEVIGWKVGGIPPHLRDVLGEDWISGPIFHKRYAQAAADVVTMPMFAGGFGAVEAEFVLELGDVSALETLAPDPEDLIPFIDACYMGVEIASSPMADINEVGPLSVISDFGNNNGLILGAKVEGWSAEALTQIAVETHVNGALVGSASAKALPDGPLSAAAFLIRNLRERNLPIPRGLKVSTGALTGIHDVSPGDTARVSFSGVGAVDIQMSAM